MIPKLIKKLKLAKLLISYLEIAKQALENITQRLIEVEVIDNTELRRLVDDTLPGPRVVPGTQNGGRNQVMPQKTEEDRPSVSGEAVG